MRRSYVLLALVSVLTASCDHFGGIDAYAPLAVLPDTSCIPRVLGTAEGVSAVKYRRTEWLASQFEIAGGASPITVAETWTYHAGRLRPRVQIYNTGNRVGYNNGIGLTAGAVSDAQIAAYRPLIERTNDLLARECGLDLSSINIREYHQKP